MALLRGFRGLCAAGAAAVIALTVLVGAAAPASASDVGDSIRAEKRVERQLTKLTKLSRERSRTFRRAVLLAQRDDDARPGRKTLSDLQHLRRAERRFNSRTTLRLDLLESRRVELEAWLDTWGIFRACPVDAPRYIHDDFGEIVNVEGVAPHVHMGSDIQAPTWTPIRAPFDGYAWGSYSPLGGYQVRVRGDRGYVFNAHLIAYGDLGSVGAGTIIGYVGDTGDSTAPHDHFEWHPEGGGAVDPYYLLTLSCD
ncbi:MAG: M23 family metallopeptidase [Actinomycetota bacterium]|nr:M23 family metallopeptidase [Actinomycetota bacterium]